MPISGSNATATTTPITDGNTSTDTELPTFNFIASWVLLIGILVLVSKSRIGYVIIYYSLLLMILLILLTEYQTFVPYLNNIQTIGQFDQSLNTGGNTNGG
jgi:type IV secretory pathway VirB3-like protein